MNTYIQLRTHMELFPSNNFSEEYAGSYRAKTIFEDT